MDSYIGNNFQQKKYKGGQGVKERRKNQRRKLKPSDPLITIDLTPHVNKLI